MKGTELAKLKLALLKENFAYREFFETVKKDPFETLPELRRPDENDEAYLSRVGGLQSKASPLFGGRASEFGLNPTFILSSQSIGPVTGTPVPAEEVITLLDPTKELGEVSSEPLSNMLPQLFAEQGIRQISRADRIIEYIGKPVKGWTQLAPYERMLVVDFRKKKKQLQREFGELIDRMVEVHQMAIQRYGELPSSWAEWEPDKTRNRKETKRHLEVWKLRRQKKPFFEIADILKITKQNAKDSFYRAYELIQGRPYNPEYDKKKLWTYKISDLKKTCETCEQREHCTSLCPDMMLYAEQDQVTTSNTGYDRRFGVLMPDPAGFSDYSGDYEDVGDSGYMEIGEQEDWY